MTIATARCMSKCIFLVFKVQPIKMMSYKMALNHYFLIVKMQVYECLTCASQESVRMKFSLVFRTVKQSKSQADTQFSCNYSSKLLLAIVQSRTHKINKPNGLCQFSWFAEYLHLYQNYAQHSNSKRMINVWRLVCIASVYLPRIDYGKESI